jgi:hypothetical protein
MIMSNATKHVKTTITHSLDDSVVDIIEVTGTGDQSATLSIVGGYGNTLRIDVEDLEDLKKIITNVLSSLKKSK